jgi:DNA-binding SARP family transcriptional activator
MPTEDAAEFRILGPLEVGIGTHRLELGGTRQQVVLAMLLLNANGVVSVDRLEEAVYGEDPPPTARAQVQISISALRRLVAAHVPATAITRQAQGYVLQVEAGWLDSRRFEELVAVELDLGRHHELVGELTELAWRYPLRERLRGQLMLALYRCGRTAEALAVYQQTRRMMIDELGLEPGAPLQRLEHDILAGHTSLTPPASPVALPARQRVPRLLPADIADFTDRAEHLSQIHRRLAGNGEAGLAVPVVVITGQGGVGKTSLAVHAAHGVAGSFGDGQLFADLHAAAAHPVGPMQVLERFLRALGVPGPQIPDGLDEFSAKRRR